MESVGGGTVTRLGGHGPRMPPLGAGPGVTLGLLRACQSTLACHPQDNSRKDSSAKILCSEIRITVYD